MRSARLVAPCVSLLLAACSSSWHATSPEPKSAASRSASTAAKLGVPPGHLPPAGACRIWMPAQPPGHQRPPEPCHGIEHHAPAGSWVLYRPSEDRKVVYVRMVDERRPGVVVRVRVYDAQRGTYLREG